MWTTRLGSAAVRGVPVSVLIARASAPRVSGAPGRKAATDGPMTCWLTTTRISGWAQDAAPAGAAAPSESAARNPRTAARFIPALSERVVGAFSLPGVEADWKPEPTSEEREALDRALAPFGKQSREPRSAWWREGVREFLSPDADPDD